MFMKQDCDSWWLDWIIDMGPDGGSKGGQVVFEGTPPQIIHAEQSITGRYLI